jgi:hypothetical protein
MPVSILGMHRSGTSMVALLLAECGLYLGLERDLMPPAPDNPAGFGENVRFVELNERLLAALGGTWDSVPDFGPGWLESPGVTSLRAPAERLIQSFAGFEPWGWKDPRSSLTFPFWERIAGRLEVVVCIRDPLEVALSLQRRNGVSLDFGLALWLEYNERIVATTSADSRIVSHYDAFFRAPRRELERVAAFIDLPVDGETLERAAGRALSSLRSYRLRRPYLRRADLLAPVAELYRSLCAEAGWDASAPATGKPRPPHNQLAKGGKTCNIGQTARPKPR